MHFIFSFLGSTYDAVEQNVTLGIKIACRLLFIQRDDFW